MINNYASLGLTAGIEPKTVARNPNRAGGACATLHNWTCIGL